MSGQNLTNASLSFGTLTNANLSNANLTNANLPYGTLANANFTGASVAGAVFAFTNLASSQLYSTASYQTQNLQGISLQGDNLTGWDFSGQNLTNADLSNGTLANANFTGADLRGAKGSPLGLATTSNTILPDGALQGLVLDESNPMLDIRNYSGDIPVHVQQRMILTEGASLVLELDGSPWGSTISFDSGIPVTLGGNLELDLVAGVDPANLVGDSYDLFNWAGVSPSGQFANIGNDLPPGYSWDTSQLYTTGQVTLVPEPSALALLAAGAATLVSCVRLAAFSARQIRRQRHDTALS